MRKLKGRHRSQVTKRTHGRIEPRSSGSVDPVLVHVDQEKALRQKIYLGKWRARKNKKEKKSLAPPIWSLTSLLRETYIQGVS